MIYLEKPETLLDNTKKSGRGNYEKGLGRCMPPLAHRPSSPGYALGLCDRFAKIGVL
jgi:hypothetical protein